MPLDIGDASLEANVSKNPILDRNPKRVAYWAFLILVGMAIVAGLQWWQASPSRGWYPTSTSRGLFTRLSDGLAVGYAFGAVGLLLSSLLFIQLWCREFSRYVEKTRYNEFLDRESQGHEGVVGALENERDRLWFIGKVTSVPKRVTPVLMLLLLVLVFAYHPVVSPTPMPTGLLVLVTFAMVALVGTMLILRWQFDSERTHVLSRLQEKLWELREQDMTNGARPNREPPEKREVSQLVVTAVWKNDETAVQTVSDPEIESAVGGHPDRQCRRRLHLLKAKIESLSEGVFRPWSQSPMGWIFGGSATIALVDGWIRWWTINL
jgi:hypothetical protein